METSIITIKIINNIWRKKVKTQSGQILHMENKGKYNCQM